MSTSLLVLFASIFITLIGCLIASKLSHRFDALFDNPRGARHKHQRRIPRIGGVALYIGFLVASAIAYFIDPPNNPEDTYRIMGILIGCTILLPIGLLDDIIELGWIPQLIGQITVSILAICTTIFIERFTNPMNGQIIELNTIPVLGTIFTATITLLWITGMMNTVNWLDGLDGLATGVGAIASILFAIHMYRIGQTEVSLYATAMAGACIGLLPFNFNPARLFLGSSGAMILGYCLATLSILAPARIATALLVMSVPISDTAWQIYHRYRSGKSIFKGDRGHLHFRLIDRGFTQTTIVLIYWLACGLFGIISLMVKSQTIKIIILLCLITLTLSYVSYLSRKKPLSG